MSFDLEQALRDFVQKMHDTIVDERYFREYVNIRIESYDPFYISHKRETEYIKQGRDTIAYVKPDKMEFIQPRIVRRVIPGDWGSYVRPNAIFFNDRHTTHEVSVEEHENVTDTLMSGIEEISVDSFNESSIKVGLEHLQEKGFIPNIILLHPRAYWPTIDLEGFTPRHQIDPTHTEPKGRTYAGQLGYLDVHWASTIDPQQAILYEKKHATCKITDLKIGFDDYERPRTLIIHEEMYAWFREKEAGVKLNIK